VSVEAFASSNTQFVIVIGFSSLHELIVEKYICHLWLHFVSLVDKIETKIKITFSYN